MKLKKVNTHLVVYTKKQAVQMLREEKNVEKVTSIKNKIIIETKPIKLNPTEHFHKRLVFGPIGKYIITILKGKKYLDTRVERIGGEVETDSGNWYSSHTWPSFSDGFCWGSAGEEVYILKKTCDWYWLAKRCLELVADDDPEEDEEELYISVLLLLQYEYALRKKNRKVQKKIEKIIFNEYYEICYEYMCILQSEVMT